MKVINIFKMNNWDIKKFLKVILLIQITLFAFIILEYAGIQIPVLRQITAFVYLTFIPGYLILRILKMHELKTIKIILYSSGVSIASLMFIGFLMNLIYPAMGIENPISLTPLTITLSAFVLILSLISYKIDDGFKKEEFIDTNDLFSPWSLFLVILPFSVIIGTYLVNYYDITSLLMFTLFITCLIPVLITFDKIPHRYYPLGIFTIALSLLFHASLISKFIAGYDIVQEYHYADLVLKNLFWDPSLFKEYNSVLSVVILAPIYSIISDLSLASVFKVIYPFIYSLVPVGIYLIYEEQTKDTRVSFLSVFLFMSIASFFLEMVSNARQEIAELFLVLLFILIFFREKKQVLYIIFILGIAVSHYSISFMYMFIFLGVWVLLGIYRNSKTWDIINKMSYSLLYFIILKPKNAYSVNNIPENSNNYLKINKAMDKIVLRSKVEYFFDKFSYLKNTRINIYMVILFFVVSLSWYIYSADSFTFINLIDVFKSALFKLSELLNPYSSQSLELILAEYNSPARMIEKYLYLITQSLIIVGFLSVLFKKYRSEFEDSYLAFSLFNLIVLFASIVLPNLAGSFNTSRFYQLSLFFLAPFFIIGTIVFFKFFIDKVKSLQNRSFEHSLKPLAAFLTIFLLFSSGIAIEFTNDYSKSMAFDKDDWVFFFQHDQDVASAQWLEKHSSGQIYADYFSLISFVTFGYTKSDRTAWGGINDTTFDTKELFNWTVIYPNDYIYVRYGDVETLKTRSNNPYYPVESGNFTKKMNKIYDSNSEIYRSSDPIYLFK